MLSPANVFATIVICVEPWSNSWLFYSYHFTIKAEMINIHKKKKIYFPTANLPFYFYLVEPGLLHTLYGSARTSLGSEDVYL